MKVTGNRAVLSEGVQMAASVAAHRSPKPALACVKIEAGKQELTLLATDLEVGVRIKVPAVEVQEAGQALVPAERVNAILRELTDEKVTLAVTGETTVIETAGPAGAKASARFKILGEDPADFPVVPEFRADGAFAVNMDVMKDMIARTLFATARESTRYALNGVLVEVEGNKIQMVATDGRRLALARGECKPVGKTTAESSRKGERRSGIVPAKAMNLIERCIAGRAGAGLAVQVVLTDREILVRSPEVDGKAWETYSRLVEGHFPKYEDVVPADKDLDKKAHLGTGEFHAAVRKAALLTTEESRGVKFQFKADGLTLSSRAPEMGEATIRMPVRYEGADLEIGFNPQFLTDALKVIEADEFVFSFQNPNKPGMITDGKKFTYVVMPVSIA